MLQRNIVYEGYVRMKVSVVLATYNGSKYIQELLDSLKNQTLAPDEVLICDDCSTDNTFEIINEYVNYYSLSTWTLYRNPANQGWVRNFHSLIKECHGDLIFTCDQDDVWDFRKIELLRSVMEKEKDISVLVSNYTPFYDEGDRGIDRHHVKNLMKDDGSLSRVNKDNKIFSVEYPGCTYCFRKSFYIKFGANIIDQVHHDDVLWAMAALNNSLSIYNKNLVKFRRHGDNASAPQKALDLQRRIDELNHIIDLQKWMLNYFYSEADTITDSSIQANNIIFIETIIRLSSFFEQRKEILQGKRIIAKFIFIYKNRGLYPTFMNLMSDIYISIRSI